MATLLELQIDGASFTYGNHDECTLRYNCHGEPTGIQIPVKGRPYPVAEWPGSRFVVRDFKKECIIWDEVESRRIYTMIVYGTTQRGPYAGFPDRTRDKIIRRTSSQEFRIEPVHVGAHKATENDAGIWQVDGQTADVAKEKDSNDYKVPLPDGAGYANVGDWVYNNASAAKSPQTTTRRNGENGIEGEATGTEDAGSPDTRFAPLLTPGGNAVLELKHIGRVYHLTRHEVTYFVTTDSNYTRNAPSNTNWGGKVYDWGPDNGRKYGPLTSGTPNTSGRWRCGEQSVERARDTDGRELLRITRTFLRVPGKLNAVWAASVYGTWPTGEW